MNLDMPWLLRGLARRRPVFHSEADFQHEIAWQLRAADPDIRSRLEVPLARPGNAALDILLRKGDRQMALELKYLSQSLRHEVDGDLFDLKAQGAADVRSYDVLKDVERMERFVEARPEAAAAVLVLTNDPLYWTGPSRDGTTYGAFSLREGRIVTGELDWADHAGPGTRKGREAALTLRGSYRMEWQDYSEIGGRFGVFRYLWLEVAPVGACLPARNDLSLVSPQ